MSQQKREIVGNTLCFRCNSSCEVRQGKMGFLYTHCKICGDNFSRTASFQEKIWGGTEFTVSENELLLSEKPRGLVLKKKIAEKNAEILETKATEPEQKQEQQQQQDAIEHETEDEQHISEEKKQQLSKIIQNNVLLYKEGNGENTDIIECDEVEESSASRAVLGVGAIICSGFFLLKLLI